MLLSVFLLSILDSANKLLVKGLHSAYVEPLRSLLRNTFSITVEENSQWQLQFTTYDDGSVAFNMLSVESSIWWDGQEYIIKQFQPNYVSSFTTYQITAIHVGYEVSRIRQRTTKTGTLTYSVDEVLSFYLTNNKLGFNWEVLGYFPRKQITDLGNGSGKDMLDQIVSTWPDAIFRPDNKQIKIYQHDKLAVNYGKRIGYLNNTSEMQLSYDSTNIVNQVLVSGKTKEDTSGDSGKTEYYFEPFLVTDQQSVAEWGLHPGDNLSDERFTDAHAMKAYALSQLSPDPVLSIEVTELEREKPLLGEIRRLENRKANFVTEVEVVAYTYYPLDNSQATSITLNNRAKTILNYKSATNRNLQKALQAQKLATEQAKKGTQRAWNARLTGTLYTPERPDQPMLTKALAEDLPIYTLQVPSDNTDFGLSAGQPFAVHTLAGAVEGLAEFVKAQETTYGVATPNSNGLMSASDKAKVDGLRNYDLATATANGLMSANDKNKLDKLAIEPREVIKMKDTSNGTIYGLQITDGKIVIKEVTE